MDLPCPEWIQYVEQKWTKLRSEETERFCLLTDIDEIFTCGLSLTGPEDLKTLARISQKFSVKKFPEAASEFRQQGNLSFKQKDYAAAALFYSKGVCHADGNTEELSLCYANRSAALFYHGLYKECLEDIQLSLEAGYPNHLQDKLRTRQTACLNQLKKSEKSNTLSGNHQTPACHTSTRNSTACTSQGVSVFFTPEKGRYMLTTDNKPAGEVVLEDEAFCCVLIPSNKLKTQTTKTEKTFGTEDRHCHHCISQSLSFVPCPNCNYVRYCGEHCRKDAWERWHRWECLIGADLLAIGVLGHLALRVALKAGQNEVQRVKKNTSDHVTCSSFKSDSPVDSPVRLSLEAHCRESSDHTDCYHGNSYMGIYSLLPHVAQHSPASRFLLAVTMAVVYKRLEDGPAPDKWVSIRDEGDGGRWQPEMSMMGATALRHMMQLRCNAQAVTAVRVKDESSMAVQSSSEIRIATAVFPVLSLLNHSCDPNTSLSFSTGFQCDLLRQFSCSEDHTEHLKSQGAVTVTVRASKDLTAGQEILHCYGPHCSRMEVKERQCLLLEQYFFHCNCGACQRDLSEGGQNEKLNTAPGLQCVKCGKSLQCLSEWYVCSWPSCGHQISRAEVQNRLQGLQRLMDEAVDLMERDRLDEALRILKSAFSQANGLLTETHPLQGELADAMARAYATTGDWSAAASHLKRSAVAVQAQFGEDSIELGRQLFKLAQLHFNGDCGAALSVIPGARRLLSLHCGPHCEELQELHDMESCIRGVI